MKLLQFVTILCLNFLLSSAQNCLDICGPNLCQSNCDNCLQGCEAVKVGLVQGCNNACNETYNPYCIKGCQKAFEAYKESIIDSLGNVQPPTILEQQKEAYSAILTFNKKYLDLLSRKFPKLPVNVTLLAQRIPDYLTDEKTAWFEVQYVDLGLKESEFVWNVTSLRPYTQYHFKVEFQLSAELGSFGTQSTLIVRTKHGGIPSKPSFLSVEVNNDLNVNIQWSPPEFISGEIAKYGIEIKAVNNTWNISKDIETKDLQKISQQSQHQRPKYTYSTGPLEYGTLYNVTVFAVTTYGHKGNLAKALVQTVQIEKDIMQDQPYLYFARGVELYRKKIDLAMPFERDELVYQFKSTLQAMDTFSADNLLFVGDDNGLLYRFNCDKNSIEKEVKSPLRNILAISVDWLYKNVYISSDSQVYRCTFELKCSLTEIVAEGSTKISHFKVDPYHGFYFWLEDNDKLVQAELCSTSQNHTSRKMERKIILYKGVGHQLSDFVMLFDQSKLQIADLTLNSLFEIDIQSQRSKNPSIAVKKIQRDYDSSEFHQVTHLFSIQSELFWTNQDSGLTFETPRGLIKTDAGKGFAAGILKFKANQPIPIPLNPVNEIKTNFDFDDESGKQLMKIQWKKPLINQQMGFQAWQEWSYEVKINDKTVAVTNDTIHIMLDIPHDKLIKIEIQPFSNKGLGPSKVIEVKSWPEIASQVKISLLKPEEIQIRRLNGLVIESLHGFKTSDLVGLEARQNDFLINNETQLMTSSGTLYFDGGPYIESFQYESVTNVTFINIPNYKMLIKFDGSQSQIFNLRGATQLQLNSGEAKLCWIENEVSIKCSTFTSINEPETVYSLPKFTEARIKILSLDKMSHQIYFFVQQVSGFDLYVIEEESRNVQAVLIHRFEGQLIQKTECIFDKCFWMNPGKLISFDVNGKSMSHMKIDQDALDFQVFIKGGSDKIDFDVVPTNPEDLQFNQNELKWTKQSNDHYEVKYDLKIEIDQEVFHYKNLQGNHFDISDLTKNLDPFTKIEVTLKSVSPWIFSSRSVSKAFWTEMSNPSSPKDLKLFFQPFKFEPFLNTSNLTYILEWDKPDDPNGPVLNYNIQVKCRNHQVCLEQTVRETNWTITSHLDFDVFEVQASNGPELNSVPTSIQKIGNLNPQPKILALSDLGVKILDLTSDSNQEILYPIHISEDPKLLTYQASQDQILVLDQNNVKFTLQSNQILPSTELQIEASNVIFDPISGYFYWRENTKLMRRTDLGSSLVVSEFNSVLSQIAMDPVENQILWLSTAQGELHRVILSNDGPPKIEKNPVKNKCSSLRGPFGTQIYVKNNNLYFIQNDHFWSFQGDSCTNLGPIDNSYEIENFVVLDEQFFWLNKTSKLLTSKIGVLSNERFKKFTEYCSSCQSIDQSQKSCFNAKIEFNVTEILSNEIEIQVQPIDFGSSCVNVMPPTEFVIALGSSHSLYYKMEHNWQKQTIEVKNLVPFTQYQLEIQAFNALGRFQDNFKGDVKTLSGVPSAPDLVKLEALTPTKIKVQFRPSEVFNSDEVQYKIHYSTNDFVTFEKNPNQVRTMVLSTILTDLKPSTNYKIWISAHTQHSDFSTSLPESVRTLDAPNLVHIIQRNPRRLVIEWKSPTSDNPIRSHQIRLQSNDVELTKPETMIETVAKQDYKYSFDNLAPGSTYNISLKLKYKSEDFIWPSGSITTPRDKPFIPGKPYLETSRIKWQFNDTGILNFELQYQDLNGTQNWTSIYENSQDFWHLSSSSLGSSEKVIFRVRAQNSFGYSDWSESSASINVEMALANTYTQSSIYPIMAGSLSAVVVVLILLCFVIVWSRKRLEKKSILGANHELNVLSQANLAQGVAASTGMAGNTGLGTMVINGMYESTTDETLQNLPKISRSQITFGKFLGSGAFGEVFEGCFASKKVAIKTLKKRESSVEFLKEAKAWSSLSHENIVEFMGICLDYHFIILEFMEGGDLSRYLKSSKAYLTLWDLVEMSLDVAKGCAYLERMHFVHRDLAARNCLLTSKTDKSQRKVKIGDFGLARDVYKSDYYRGGGYLPVKWMSPESLTEHIFTTQSDVWSFGVLIWEIMTLGQRPYAEKGNAEVRNFVCHNRGHLEVPQRCPEKLGQELLKCWAFNPSDRPTFSELLNTINEFMIFKEELQSTLCCQDNSSLCHETSRDTWKTFGTGTTLPCPPRSPTSVSLPLPPEVSPSWLPNPCSDVDSTTSAPALTSQNYLRLLSKASDTNGYVTPRPASAVTCGCQQYQNMVTNHVCPSTSSAA